MLLIHLCLLEGVAITRVNNCCTSDEQGIRYVCNYLLSLLECLVVDLITERLERAPRSSVSSDVTASSAYNTRGTSTDTHTSVVIRDTGNSCKISTENNTRHNTNQDNKVNISNSVANSDHTLDTACQEARALLEDDDLVGEDEQDDLLLEALRRSLMEQGK